MNVLGAWKYHLENDGSNNKLFLKIISLKKQYNTDYCIKLQSGDQFTDPTVSFLLVTWPQLTLIQMST